MQNKLIVDGEDPKDMPSWKPVSEIELAPPTRGQVILWGRRVREDKFESEAGRALIRTSMIDTGTCKDDKGEYWTRCMVVARQAAAVAAQCNSKKGKKRKREAALKGKMQDFSILVSNIFDECDEPDSEAEEISDVDSDFDELEE